MKIHNERRRKILQKRSIKKASVPNQAGSLFSAIMEEKEENLAVKALKESMKVIEERGEALKRSRTLGDLNAYKKEIKAFLKAATSALQAKQFSRIGPDGSMRLYTVIEKVDQALQDLSQEVLAKEQNNMAIAGKIDEIRGLLLDVFL